MGGNNAQGFDCSGYVCEILRPSGLIGNKEDLTAAAIHNKFKSKVVGSPSLGCLVFYGRDIRRITHVAFMITEDIILEAGVEVQALLMLNPQIRLMLLFGLGHIITERQSPLLTYLIRRIN